MFFDAAAAMCLLMAIAVLKPTENLIRLTARRLSVIIRTKIPKMGRQKMKKVVLVIDTNRDRLMVLIALWLLSTGPLYVLRGALCVLRTFLRVLPVNVLRLFPLGFCASSGLWSVLL